MTNFTNAEGTGSVVADTVTATTVTAGAFVGPISGASSLDNGTVALPALSFTSDPDTGLYRIGANNAGFSANGAKVLDIGTSGLGVVGVIANGNGAVGAPAFSFTADPDCGTYRIGANNLGVAVNGAKVLDIATTGLGVTGLISSTTTITAGTALVATTTVTGVNVIATGFVQTSVGNALTAVGTNRATSLALTKGINNVTTAAAGTGVTLEASATVGVGGNQVIFNAGANAIQVYGNGSDTIDGVAAATGVPLTNAKRAVFWLVAANTWISSQLGVVSA